MDLIDISPEKTGLYGKKYTGVVHSTVVIAIYRTVKNIVPKVSPECRAQEILQLLQQPGLTCRICDNIIVYTEADDAQHTKSRGRTRHA